MLPLPLVPCGKGALGLEIFIYPKNDALLFHYLNTMLSAVKYNMIHPRITTSFRRFKIHDVTIVLAINYKICR